MIVVLFTSCLDSNYNRGFREEQYVDGFRALREAMQENGLSSEQVRLIAVENCGPRTTLLDDFGFDNVLYTNSQSTFPTQNTGIKEMSDILECIRHFDLHDDDFIVKLTGRYRIQPQSPFMKELVRLRPETEAILRYGSFMSETAPKVPVRDCITGLVGTRVRHVKSIRIPTEKEALEWCWAEEICKLNQANVVALPLLGVSIQPRGINRGFFVV